MDYLYDGSFEGLLTCIYYNYKLKSASGIYNKFMYQQSILNICQNVETNSKYSDIVYDAIENKICHEALINIYYAFLSDFEYKENEILKYIRYAFRIGSSITNLYTDDNVYKVLNMRKSVSRERHFFTGVLRFADICGVLYAKYSPDNNITEILTSHFADRFKNEKFIIHDKKRKIASVYADNNWQIVDATNMKVPELTDDETEIARLWQHYFTSHAIDNRKNMFLQYAKIPVRYRKNICEFKVYDVHK